MLGGRREPQPVRAGTGRNGRGKGGRLKGRPLDDAALDDVRRLLGDAPRRRDLLIEHLHLLQDEFGGLTAAHLKALSHEMRLSEAEVFEVASFYHHFDIVTDGAELPPLTIRVCDSLSCMMAGAEQLIAELETRADPREIRVVRAACQGRCSEAPAAQLGRNEIGNATADGLLAAAERHETSARPVEGLRLDGYRAKGGYALLEACLADRHKPEDLIATLSDAGLRGLGGAGFPAGRKWDIVRSFAGPRLMTINGDEGEPGTFKDRIFLEQDPHRMLEGALIAAWAVGAERIYLYMRDEYPGVLEVLRQELDALAATGLCDHAPIELRRGAGAYICGEESAMLESIEGKRGLPRHRPPYIAEKGLFGRPTLNHNIETLYWVRDILEHGAERFAGHGKDDHSGLRSFSVSGRVRNPGVAILPTGSTIHEIIEACGGMADGHTLAGFLPGGASGGIFPASMADLPMDFGTFEPHGGFIGSHAVVILSDQDDMKAVALNLLRFFKHESCGQCTPCRTGTEKMVAMLERGDWDQDRLGDLEQVMRDASICGLGQAASNPMRSVLKFFAQESAT
ncbi:NADH-ubiquinone oxidoreductase-F iron-sulfur binding region domain-containing protein [Stappia sp. ES.058]|uniref:NADH-ubiquinone oxidoreductase-F iron-sulfur binding region domain-containing protein n=1 Tax=Stappia sp. ES.058 TaxID=1881061 RepID=UPI00087B97B8|nr:NADH-ubiquinone oxidoreductase-F iron-sulfur binding region domain-containing protein [Stappia sp. ES.058]SDT97713.1 NAD-dependent formate dehydrogenase flavoprotein subunit [Stappia sp. ES.058]